MNCNPCGSLKSDGAGNFKQPMANTLQTGSLHTKNSLHGRFNLYNQNTTISSKTTPGNRRFKMRSYSLDGGHWSWSPSERASRHYMPSLSQKANVKDSQKLSNQEKERLLPQTTGVCQLSGVLTGAASQIECQNLPRDNAVETETSLSTGSFHGTSFSTFGTMERGHDRFTFWSNK